MYCLKKKNEMTRSEPEGGPGDTGLPNRNVTRAAKSYR